MVFSNNSNLKLLFGAGIGLRGVASYFTAVIKKGVKFTSGFVLPAGGLLEEMSVFKGNILEYPGIIVDRFNPVNCRRGRAFFLSHCHKGSAKCISQ